MGLTESIGLQRRAEHPMATRTPAFVMVTMSASASKVPPISLAIVKTVVLLKDAEKATQLVVKMIKHFRQNGSGRTSESRICGSSREGEMALSGLRFGTVAEGLSRDKCESSMGIF